MTTQPHNQYGPDKLSNYEAFLESQHADYSRSRHPTDFGIAYGLEKALAEFRRLRDMTQQPVIRQSIGGFWAYVGSKFITSDGRTFDSRGDNCWHDTREAAEAAVAKYQALQSPRPTVSPLEAVPGRWYESEKWGRVLACGRSNPGMYQCAFAVRVRSGATEMRYLLSDEGQLTESEVQAWE